LSPRRILIVVDELSLQFRSTPRVRDQMRRMLRVLRRNGDLVGLTTTGRSGVAMPLSANWDSLDSAVARVIGEALAPRAIANARGDSEDAAELRARATVAFSTVVTALRSMAAGGSSPTIVVYFTEGYPALTPATSELVEEALRMKVMVYAIDPRGFGESDGTKPWDAKDWDAYIAATHPRVRALAGGLKGVTVFTRDEFDAFLSRLDRSSPAAGAAHLQP
jgi:hypothetical protein